MAVVTRNNMTSRTTKTKEKEENGRERERDGEMLRERKLSTQ